MMAALEAARDALALIPGITSCKIGTEDGISPADFPLIRIEPLRVTPGQPYSKRTCEAVVHFGLPVGQSDADDGGGLELVFQGLFELEAQVLAVLKTLSARYVETIVGDQEQMTFRTMGVRCELRG